MKYLVLLMSFILISGCSGKKVSGEELVALVDLVAVNGKVGKKSPVDSRMKVMEEDLLKLVDLDVTENNKKVITGEMTVEDEQLLAGYVMSRMLGGSKASVKDIKSELDKLKKRKMIKKTFVFTVERVKHKKKNALKLVKWKKVK